MPMLVQKKTVGASQLLGQFLGGKKGGGGGRKGGSWDGLSQLWPTVTVIIV